MIQKHPQMIEVDFPLNPDDKINLRDCLRLLLHLQVGLTFQQGPELRIKVDRFQFSR